MIHLASIASTDTSVNPARSIGAAVFADCDLIAQLWAFIVFSLIGGVAAVFPHHLVQGEK